MADDNDVEIGVKVNTGDSTSKLDGVAGGVKKVGEAASGAVKPTNDLVAATEHLLQTKIEQFAAKAADGGRGVAMSYNQTRNALNMFRDSLLQTYGSMEAVPPEAAQKLRAYEQAVAGAARKTDELKDAQELSRITGSGAANQLDAVGRTAEQIGRMFGPAGESIGRMAGNLGNAAAGADQLGDMISGLNMEKVGKDAAGFAGQVGLAAGALTAGAAAGGLFAAQNAQNAQLMKDFGGEIKSAFGGALDTVQNFVAGANAVLQVFFSRLVDAGSALGGLFSAMASGDWDGAKKSISDLAKTVKGYSGEVALAVAAAIAQRKASEASAEQDKKSKEEKEKLTVATAAGTEADKAATEAAKIQTAARAEQAKAEEAAAKAFEAAAARRRAAEDATAVDLERAIAGVMKARATGDAAAMASAGVALELTIQARARRLDDAFDAEKLAREELERQQKIVTGAQQAVTEIAKPAEAARAAVASVVEPIVAEYAKINTAASSHLAPVQALIDKYAELTVTAKGATAAINETLSAHQKLRAEAEGSVADAEPSPGDVNTITMGGRTVSVEGRAS